MNSTRPNHLLRTALKAGNPQKLVWLSLGSLPLLEIALQQGAKAIVLDRQHGLWNRENIEHAIGYLPKDVIGLVRVENATQAAIEPALDCGADGIIAPMIENAEKASMLVELCHFPPFGIRSAGALRSVMNISDYRRACAKNLTIGAMVETEQAVANAEEIAAVKGIDYIFIGSGDLAISMDIQQEAGAKKTADAARMQKALQHVRKACTKANKPCGIFTPNHQAAKDAFKDGFTMAVSVSDMISAMASYGDALQSPEK